MDSSLSGKHVLVLGGTGSLGKRLFWRILSSELERPASLTVFSRDEAKQHEMRLQVAHASSATDEIIYRDAEHTVRFMIGDVRDYPDVRKAVDRADVIF